MTKSVDISYLTADLVSKVTLVVVISIDGVVGAVVHVVFMLVTITMTLTLTLTVIMIVVVTLTVK